MINNILNKVIEYFQNLLKLKWHQKLYISGTFISLIFFAISIFGIAYNYLEHISILKFILKLYISIVLIINFNPFIKYNKSDIQQRFDRKLAFTAGIFLLLTTGFIDSLEYYIKFAKENSNIL
jgi:hypothetical protein